MFLKRLELSRKEIKILEYGLKARLGARTGSRKLKKGVQNAPKHGSAFGVQEYHLALLKCRTVLLKCQIGLFWALAQLSLSADKVLPFRLFRRKTRPDLCFACRC